MSFVCRIGTSLGHEADIDSGPRQVRDGVTEEGATTTPGGHAKRNQRREASVLQTIAARRSLVRLVQEFGSVTGRRWTELTHR